MRGLGLGELGLSSRLSLGLLFCEVGSVALPSPTSWLYPGSKRTPCSPTLKSLKRSVSQSGCTFPGPQLRHVERVLGVWMAQQRCVYKEGPAAEMHTPHVYMVTD